MYCSSDGRCQPDSPELHVTSTAASMRCADSFALVCPIGSKCQEDKNQKGQGASHL